MSQWYSLDAVVSMVSGEVSPALERAVRGFWENPTLVPVAATRQITLEYGPLPPIPAQASRATLTLMEQTVQAAWHGNQLWLGSQAPNDLWAEVGTQHSRVVIGQTDDSATDSAAAQAAWALALTEIHRAGGWLPLHAAVVARGGKAVAITGVSGVGKSTAILRLAALGYSVICEDRAFWHAQTGRVMGLDRFLRAFPESLELFAPQLLPAALRGPRDIKGKLMLPLQPDLASATLVKMLTLEPEQSPPPSLSGRVKALWETTGVPLTDLARQQVQAGVSALLPLGPQPVTRETVLEAVQAILDS